MRPLPVLLVLAACGGEPLDLPVPDATPGMHGPPAGSLPQLQVSPWRSGQPIRARVTNAPVGASAFVLASTRGTGEGPCHPTLPLCTDLRAPLDVLTSGTVDGAGEVLLEATPTSADAQWLQVALLSAGGGQVYAMPVQLRVRDDADGDLVVDARDNCPDTPNDSQFDDDGDGWGNACDCDDTDDTIFPGAADTPGDFIDGDCDGVDAGTTPATFAGTYTGTASLSLGGELLGLDTLGLDALPCSGSVTFVVDPAATPAITGSGSCAVSLYGIAGPSYPFSLVAETMRFRPSGEFEFLGATDTWTGIFGTDGATPTLTASPSFDSYGLTISGVIESTQ